MVKKIKCGFNNLNLYHEEKDNQFILQKGQK